MFIENERIREIVRSSVIVENEAGFEFRCKIFILAMSIREAIQIDNKERVNLIRSRNMKWLNVMVGAQQGIFKVRNMMDVRKNEEQVRCHFIVVELRKRRMSGAVRRRRVVNI